MSLIKIHNKPKKFSRTILLTVERVISYNPFKSIVLKGWRYGVGYPESKKKAEEKADTFIKSKKLDNNE